MRIGMAQIKIPMKSFEKNREKCREYFYEAKEKGVEMLVFPEMTLTGFDVTSKKIVEYADETNTFFEEMAKECNMYAVYGCAEKGVKKYKNQLKIVGPEGLIFDYSKMHPFSMSAEHKFFEGGDKVSECTIQGHNYTGFVCYDIRFPEIFQYAGKTSDCIFVIANWPASRSNQWNALLKARAIDTFSFVVGVNCTGTSGKIVYNGMSAAYRPDSTLIAGEQEEEGIIVADLDFDWLKYYRDHGPYNKDRRPELYREFYM